MARGKGTWGIVACACACVLGACSGGGDGRNGLSFGSGVGTDSGGTAGTAASESGADDGGVDSSGGDGTVDDGASCPGECVAGDSQTQACAGGDEQFRVCNLDCTWSPWSACGEPMGECTPGTTQNCGECMEQTCDALGVWGECAMSCTFTCLDAARNGDEICDDQAFDMPAEPLYLVCVTAEGGVAYVAHNTGPAQRDGVTRCQGWEDNGQNAWDFLDYEQQMDCDAVNKSMPINLAAGASKWYGVHDQPAGGGHFTEVCIATLQ